MWQQYLLHFSVEQLEGFPDLKMTLFERTVLVYVLIHRAAKSALKGGQNFFVWRKRANFDMMFSAWLYLIKISYCVFCKKRSSDRVGHWLAVKEELIFASSSLTEKRVVKLKHPAPAYDYCKWVQTIEHLGLTCRP